MDKEQKAPQAPTSSKYNYEAMSAYNFDNMDFDIDFGTIDDKKHKEIMKEAADHEK